MKALQNIKVIDWTIWQFGPIAATMLGDLGADVIKIESLDGDPGRAVFSASGVDRSLPAGRNAYFEANHRNKRSIALDLKRPEGVEIARKLADNADVFIQNYRKGVAERLGLDYETLKASNPALIYASGSGYGPLGPDADLPALDAAAQARSGLMFATAADGEDPYPVQGVVGDQIGGITLGWGILAALVARSIHGVGQRVDVSHLSSSVWLQGLAVSMGLLTRHKPDSEINLTYNPPRTDAYNPLANYYKCADDRWIMLANFQADRYWSAFAAALGLDAPHRRSPIRRHHLARRKPPPTNSHPRRAFAQKTYDQWAANTPKLRRLHLLPRPNPSRTARRPPNNRQRLHNPNRTPRPRTNQPSQPPHNIQPNPLRHPNPSPRTRPAHRRNNPRARLHMGRHNPPARQKRHPLAVTIKTKNPPRSFAPSRLRVKSHPPTHS